MMLSLRRLALTILAAGIGLCASAQVIRNNSEAVELQIKQNANAGLDEWNGIDTKYTIRFSDQIDSDQLAAIDEKLLNLHPDIMKSCQSESVGGLTVMTIVSPHSAEYADIKVAISRFNFRLSDIEMEYVLAR